MKFFIDENLSPSLVAACHQAGHDATCSRDRNLLGSPDHDVLAYAIAEDTIIVTNDASDFRALCAAEGLHPGLIVLEGTARTKSRLLLSAALEHIQSRSVHEKLAARDFMLNRAVEVDLDGNCSDYEIPPEDP